jgi:hypothetical protein
MPYCGNCGAAHDPNQRFCAKCGTQLNIQTQQTTQPAPQQQIPVVQQPVAAPAPPAAPVQSASEAVVGTILFRKPKSLGRYDTWTAIVTTQRMIFAQMTSQMLTDAAMQARDQAKAEGKGFFGQWGDQLKATFSYTQRYLNMDPNAALAETPGNFAVNNDTIQIKLKLRTLSNNQHEFEVEINSPQGTFEFKMEERQEFVDLLKRVYGERVKMPTGYWSSHGVRVKLF